MNNLNKNIYYRTAKDQNTLKLINKDISLALGKPENPSTFNTTEAIIVTYDNVPKNGDSSKRFKFQVVIACLLYTSPSPRDATLSRMPSSA